MERVYLVEDGLGYGERAVVGVLSVFGSRGRVYFVEGLSKFAEGIGINKGTLLYYLRSLERKGYLEVNRRKLSSRILVADLKLNLKNGRWIKVPRSFFLTGSPKERGLLLTLASRAKPYKLSSEVKVKKTAFRLRDLFSHDARTEEFVRKLLRSLQSRGFILIERTRPFYVVRVIM